MVKTTILKKGYILLFFLLSFNGIAQNLIPFVPRYDEAIKGDMLLIGNSNLSVHPTDPYNYAGTNSSYNNEGSNNRDRMVYVDIDIDNTTFNSIRAVLDVPNDATCYQIVYAGLSAGWSLFVIHEDPFLPSKNITSFVGFTKTHYKNPNNQQTFPITDFQIIPIEPVLLKYVFSALEGDRDWTKGYYFFMMLT